MTNRPVGKDTDAEGIDFEIVRRAGESAVWPLGLRPARKVLVFEEPDGTPLRHRSPAGAQPGMVVNLAVF